MDNNEIDARTAEENTILAIVFRLIFLSTLIQFGYIASLIVQGM